MTPREVGEGCCQEARREHRAFIQAAAAAQARHGTAQASEQGAEGGRGVLTELSIDVTDAGMAMVPVRPVWENAYFPMVSRLLLAANSTLVNFEHWLKACGDVQYRQGGASSSSSGSSTEAAATK